MMSQTLDFMLEFYYKNRNQVLLYQLFYHLPSDCITLWLGPLYHIESPIATVLTST